MTKRAAWLMIAAAALATACDDASTPMDGGPDGVDAGDPVDAGAPEDAASPTGDAAAADAGTVDGGGADPAAALMTLRGLDGAVDPAIAVDGVIVTYVRSDEVGDDPAGFFAQVDADGPGVFVAVDPAGLDPAPAAGDTVRFDVTRVDVFSSQLRVTALEGWARLDAGADLGPLVQDLSDAADADSANVYESELVRATGTLVGADAAGGTAHRRFRFVTSTVDSDDLVLRMPDTVLDAVPLVGGCEVEVGPSPAWRFDSATQLMAYEAGQLSVVSCPPLAVASADAADPTHVTVRFTRPLDPASVDAADFTFAGGSLSALSTTVDGDTVTVTTGEMTDGVTYTVIVSGVTDATGTAVGSMNNASFRGIGVGSPSLLFTEYVEGTGENRALEITNLGAVGLDLSLCQIRLYPNGGTSPAVHTLPAMFFGAGDTFVVCHPSATGATLAACDQMDATPVNFNGNDAVELFCDGAAVDVIGQIGADPGSGGWTSGAVSTVDQTLRRRCGIGVGDADGSDAFDPATQWDGAALDDVTDLGGHCGL